MRKGFPVLLMMGIALVLAATGGLAAGAGLRQLPPSEPAPSTAPHRQVARASLQTSAGSGQGIQSTSRISIPFGITTPLLMPISGQRIRVAGHGGCTEGQQVTVQVTLTQTSTAALATGQTQEVCTGVLQFWSSTAAATTGALFEAEPARACGVAETREGKSVTDRFVWCRDVNLVYGVYLPLVLQHEEAIAS